jgi:hypothetical protein
MIFKSFTDDLIPYTREIVPSMHCKTNFPAYTEKQTFYIAF